MSVLIITNNSDHVTDYVIDWLLYFNCKVFRLSFEDFIKKASIWIDAGSVSRIKIEGSQIKSGWLRKVTYNDAKLVEFENQFGFKDGYELFKFINKESSVLKQSILNGKNYNWLCDYNSANVNKLEVLQLAIKCNLAIPRTAIINNISDLNEFTHKYNINNFVVKSVGENLSLYHKQGVSIFQPVKSFNVDAINSFPEKFSPTFIQEEIKKKIDIRVFYLNKQVYSMAIEAENIDCRLFDKNTKYYPIELPETIKLKIINLMDNLNLNIGCVDLVMDYEDEIYFLEVTPTGEFSQLSRYCNYEIEKEIAKLLSYES